MEHKWNAKKKSVKKSKYVLDFRFFKVVGVYRDDSFAHYMLFS